MEGRCRREHRRNAGTTVPLTVLSVAYPLAQISQATAGGAEQVLLAIDRALVENGHGSLVLAAAGSKCNGLLLPVQIPVGNLDDRAKMESQRLFRTALNQALDRHSIDVIHMHGIDFDRYLPDCELPIIVTLHLPLEWYSWAALTIRRKNISLVCVSRSQARTAQANTSMTRIIPNGVNLAQFQSAHRKSDYVLFMGRICPEKGVHHAIEAAQRAGEKLLIAGTVFDYREHREYFESKVRPRLGQNAVFVGAIGGQQKADLLSGAKCLLIPSSARETSSLIAMEAMASGTPVVAWTSGALPEIVTEGRTGFLVSSVEGLAHAIGRAALLNSTECRREAEARFSSARMVSAYFELYDELVQGPRMPELQAA
jgi:glycosyltransferase involved in cell wall biosynthesis